MDVFWKKGFLITLILRKLWWLWRILSTRPISFSAYLVLAPAASAHTQYTLKLRNFGGKALVLAGCTPKPLGRALSMHQSRILSVCISSWGAYSANALAEKPFFLVFAV